MKRILFIGAAALAVSSALASATEQPESLLPPGFDDPAPAPSPAPAPRPTASQPTTPAQPATPAPGVSGEVVQPIPDAGAEGPLPPLPAGFPSIAELEDLEGDELDELLGLKPRYDIPPAARRSMERVGVIAAQEGGFAVGALDEQPASIVRAALGGMRGPVVSRWGHILLRRALASRLEAPQGMSPVEFAALRAATLTRIGEFGVARSLVQDVDTGNWNDALTNAAIDAYIGTGDITGACPVVQIRGGVREDPQWRMLQGICFAYAGQGARSNSVLSRVAPDEGIERIDILLAQRFAGGASSSGRAVNIEWDEVEGLTPWRFALASAVGEPIPDGLLSDAGPYYRRVSATNGFLTLEQRASGADSAAQEGILSSRAMVDLYSQIYAQEGVDGASRASAARLRDAYVADDPAARAAAIRDIWDAGGADPFGRFVLTAYAAARIQPSSDLEDEAGDLIASMLTAGLDRNAMRWESVVADGSLAWAQIALARPGEGGEVSEAQIRQFIDDDDSAEARKSQFLLAGLAGLGRVSPSVQLELATDLGMSLTAGSRWAQLIESSAEVNNPVLVAYLAGVGMQGSSWDKMTPRHLYHIVSALNRVGLSAEARMIAAEAVARG